LIIAGYDRSFWKEPMIEEPMIEESMIEESMIEEPMIEEVIGGNNSADVKLCN